MTTPGNIPFLDLISLHKELEPELMPVFQKVLQTAGFIGGPEARPVFNKYGFSTPPIRD